MWDHTSPGRYLQQVVSHPERQVGVALDPGGHHSGAVPVTRHHERVIDGDPELHVVPEGLEAEVRVLLEDAHHLRAAPAAEGLLQVVGQVPVVQRDHRLHADLLQPPEERPVVVGADLVVAPARPVGEHPGPGQGEAVVADPELPDGSDVGVDVVVAVAAHVPGGHPVPSARKGVPNGEPLAVLLERALHLVRGRAHRPHEVPGEGVVEERLVSGVRHFAEATPRFQASVGFGGAEGGEEREEGEQGAHGSGLFGPRTSSSPLRSSPDHAWGVPVIKQGTAEWSQPAVNPPHAPPLQTCQWLPRAPDARRSPGTTWWWEIPKDQSPVERGQFDPWCLIERGRGRRETQVPEPPPGLHSAITIHPQLLIS